MIFSFVPVGHTHSMRIFDALIYHLSLIVVLLPHSECPTVVVKKELMRASIYRVPINFFSSQAYPMITSELIWPWCFSDHASWIDCILITNFCALIIIYSKNINLLYMFRVSSAHFQEDTVVHMQHMVLSLSMRVPGGL